MQVKYLKLLILLNLCFLFFACKPVSEIQSFEIGKGGGFTGKYDIYQLNINGEVYSLNSGNSVLLKKISGKTMKLLFEELEKLRLQDIQFNEPGNITFYIRYIFQEKPVEVKWGSSKKSPPPAVSAYFEKVWDIIRNSK